MDHYEVLNINRSASQQEIQKAYIIAKAAYQKDSLAHYNLVSEGERKEMMTQIERAYLTLSHPKKRRKYDLRTFQYKNENKEASFYRGTTQKMVIEDGEIRFRQRLFCRRKGFYLLWDALISSGF